MQITVKKLTTKLAIGWFRILPPWIVIYCWSWIAIVSYLELAIATTNRSDWSIFLSRLQCHAGITQEAHKKHTFLAIKHREPTVLTVRNKNHWPAFFFLFLLHCLATHTTTMIMTISGTPAESVMVRMENLALPFVFSEMVRIRYL